MSKKKAPAATGKSSRSGGTGRKPDSRADGLVELRRFVLAHPHGWNHGDWLGLLQQLRDQGHAVEDADKIGASLERERLAVLLDGVAGVGPRRRQAIIDRYGTVWNLRNADPGDLAKTVNLPRSLAERIRGAAAG